MIPSYEIKVIKLPRGKIMQLFHKNLDKNTPVPLYFQLKTILLNDIKDNCFAVGDSIPTESELVEFYHISRSTVRQAISELVQEGWLTRKASKGTFVTRPEQTLLPAGFPIGENTTHGINRLKRCNTNFGNC